MRRCFHYKAVKGCPECKREPPILCIHGELKGACGKCFAARDKLVESKATSNVIQSMRKQPPPVGPGWDWFYADSTHKETLGWFLVKGFMLNETYERFEVRIAKDTKRVRFNFTAQRLLSGVEKEDLERTVYRANNL